MDNPILVPIAILVIWVTIVIATWIYVRHREHVGTAYTKGWEDGWKQHVAAQLSEDPEYRRIYTEGWLGALDTLESQFDSRAAGWRDRI